MCAVGLGNVQQHNNEMKIIRISSSKQLSPFVSLSHNDKTGKYFCLFQFPESSKHTVLTSVGNCMLCILRVIS